MIPTLLPGCPWRPWLLEWPHAPGFGNERPDPRSGRVRVNLGRGHMFADASGRQARARLVAAYHLGAMPAEGLDVDHADGDLTNDESGNLVVIDHADHSRMHNAGRRWSAGAPLLVCERL